MKGRIWIYVGVAVALVLGVLFFLRTSEEIITPDPTHSDRGRPHGFSSKRDEKIEYRGSREEADENSKFIATPLSRPPKPEILDKIEYPKYRFAGSGIRGAIRDAEGEVIWRASEETPVYSIAASPNGKRIVAGAGDGNAYIITSEGEKVLDLPQFPPGKDMLGLGNWVWIDDERLLGESGVQKFDEHGQAVGCCQGHNVSESRFYVYDRLRGELEEMRLPDALRGKVVNIARVLDSGKILMGHEGDEFGWYEVASSVDEPGQ